MGVARQFEEQFAVESFTETFDRPAALYLLQHAEELNLSAVPDCLEEGERQKISPQEALEHLLHRAKRGNTLQVRYDKSPNDTNRTRRWYAKGRMSLQRLSKILRATLCKDLYIDLDFVNCGPTLLLILCQRHAIPCEWLSKVVEDRDNMLKEFEPFYTRDEAKQVRTPFPPVILLPSPLSSLLSIPPSSHSRVQIPSAPPRPGLSLPIYLFVPLLHS